MNTVRKNTGRDLIIKLAEELPESKVGEAIDFLRFLKQKKDPVLYLSPEEEEELQLLQENGEYVTLDEAEK